MKVKNDNVLWLQNSTRYDANVSDLGVKVPAGRTVNVYASNPYLTTDKVAKSLESGSLYLKLNLGLLKVVRKNVETKPSTLNRIKESKETNAKAMKTKSSVVIDSKVVNEEEGESFDFADYGVGDLAANSRKQSDGSVVIKPDDLELPPETTDTVLKPVVESGLSQQSQVIMKVAQASMVDPTGPIAKASVPTLSQPFTVVAPKKEEGVWVAVDQEKILTSPDGAKWEPRQGPLGEIKTPHLDASGAIVMGEAPARSMKRIAAESEADGAIGEEAEIAEADLVIKFDESVETTPVAGSVDGAIVMQTEEEPEKKAPRKRKSKNS